MVGLTHGRGISGSNLLGGSARGRELAPETVRFAAPLWCPPSGGVGSSPPRAIWFIAEVRSLIKICANKKIGEERRGDYPEAGINLEYEGKTNLKQEIDLKCEGKTLKTENQPEVRALPEATTRC